MYNSTSFRKGISLVTLTAFVFSLFSPFANVAFAGTPDAAITYSSDPAGTGSLTISIETNETLAPGATISIDQPGTVDIVDDTLTDLGSGTGFTYIYTVMEDDGSNYVDGTAIVTLSGVSVSTGDPINIVSGGSFTITTLPPLDTEAPVVTLSGGNMSVALGGIYTEPGASWTDNADGTGETFVGIYGVPGSFAISGSVNTGSVGAYYIDYMKVDNAGNGSGATRRVDVVSPANLRNATVAPPSNNKISSITNQETGRFGLSAGIDAIRLENIDITNIGTSTLSDIAASSTGVELREVSGNTLLTTGTISGQTISFSGVNFIIPSYTTTNFKVTLPNVATLDPYYGQTLQLTTNSGMVSIVKDGDSSPLAVDESMFSGNMKLYTVSIVPPSVNLTANSLALGTRIGKIRVSNVDSSTGLTVSGVTLQVSMTGGFTFTGSICLRDLGSSSSCGGIGTTTGQTITENGGIYIFDIVNSTLLNNTAILAPNSGFEEYEVYIDNAPLWIGGDVVQTSLTDLEYTVGAYTQVQSYVGVGSATMISTYGVLPDTTPPIVSLSGSSTVSGEYGYPYVDAGASWTDNADGTGDTLTGSYGSAGSFTVSGTVNTGAVGNYALEYKKVDMAGNVNIATRTINIVSALSLIFSGATQETIFQDMSSGALIGQFAVTTGLDPLIIRKIELANSGTVNLENIINVGTGIKLKELYSGVEIGAVVSISGQTLTFSGMNDIILPGETRYYTIFADITYGSGNYGETISLKTSGPQVDAIKYYGSASVVVTDDLQGPSLQFILAPGAPALSITPSGQLDTNSPIATIHIQNDDTWSGVTLSDVYMQIEFTGSAIFSGSGCLRASGSLSPCGSLGTTLPINIDQNTNTTVGWELAYMELIPQYLAAGGGSKDYELLMEISPQPSWTAGDKFTVSIGSLVYTGGNIPLYKYYGTGVEIQYIAPVDTTPPVVTLSGAASMNILYQSGYTELGASWSDDIDGTGDTFAGIYGQTGSFAISGSVNTGALGTYILEYLKVDAAGNSSGVTRTVNVVDNTAPIVTPVDGSFITLTQGDSYTESGASWTDNVDGTGFLAVPYTGSVDTNTVGSYLVEYRYTDGAGNVGMGFRTVTVNDTTPPVITLSGSATVNVEYGSSFVDDGASWTDNVDGSGVISGYTSGSVNTGTLGTYIVSYEYTDGAGNMGTGVSRTVIVEDTVDPVVTLSGAATVNVVVGDTYTESGAYWTDVDGVYGTILTASSGTVDTNSTGTYLLDYIHADSSGNTGSVTRTVQVLSGPDLTPPVITLSGSSPITVEQGSLYTDDGATAIDDIDGDITVSINTVNPVNTALTGTYIVTYDVTDAGGNPATQVTRTVNVVDTTVPTISLLGVSSVDVEYGSSFVDDGAEWDDGFNGTGMISGYNSGSLDVNTLGTYTIGYEYADLSGNVGIGATRSVNVVDTTAPVLSPIGGSPVSLVVGDTYTESGASWTDIHDGTGVVMTPFSGSVDTNTIGSYLLEYEYADISGNTGATSRTVNVLSAPDTTPPVITLFGSAALNVEIGSSYTELGASWTDNVDGSGTISTPTIGSVNIGSIGTYVLGYSYTDGAGNLGSVNRTVNVVDTTSPTASVTYSTLSTTSGSVTATLTGASESIVITNNGGSPTYTFTTNGSFTFTFQDMTGGNTGSTVANVANIDTTAPVITLLGVSPTTVSQGSTYVDMGVIATDNVDGTITPSVTVSGSVTTATIGSYTLTYNVSDSVGNTATPVSRIVNVIVAAPIVTAPAVGAGGGGGGGSASTAVSPLVSSNPNGQTALQNQNMTLGITALERILREQKANRETQASETVEGISPVESISIVVNDIANSESHDAITTLIEKGYVKNTKKFDPKRPMTRAEFVKVLSLAYGFEDMGEGETSFTDMRGSEFQKYVEFGVIMGWINPDMKKFRPNDAITLGEALKLLDAAQGTGDAHAPVINKEILSREDAAALIVEEMEVE